MVSERATLSHEAERHLILIFTIKWNKNSVSATRRGLFLSLFGEINMRQGGNLYNLFPKFQCLTWNFGKKRKTYPVSYRFYWINRKTTPANHQNRVLTLFYCACPMPHDLGNTFHCFDKELVSQLCLPKSRKNFDGRSVSATSSLCWDPIKW